MITDVGGASAPVLPFGSLKERLKKRVAQRLSIEEASGRRLALRGRTVALVAIAILVAFLAPYPALLYYQGLIALFILLGFARLALEHFGLYRRWYDYLLISLDCWLLAFTLIYPNPISAFDYPPQLALRFDNFAYFYVLLAGVAIGFDPRRVLWCGLMGALAWSAGVAWLVSLPDTVIGLPEGDGTLAAQLQVLALPTHVALNGAAQSIVVYLIVAGLMALTVARARRSIERQARLERERSNLARYFPPATVDRLATQDQALTAVREQNAAVLFFDLVGFTHWAEQHQPSEVIEMLREVHARVETAIFTHDGTLDKFIGDGAMATFGAVDPGPREATNALACAVAMVEELKSWNARRRAPVRASVGVHYGPVVVGNIGTDRRVELAALGDTVNVASRLEALTRQVGGGAVISVALADAARAESGDEAAALLARFRGGGRWELRGRDETVDVLVYG